MHLLEIVAAVGTVGGTWALVFFTWRLVREQQLSVKEQHSLVEGQLSIGREQLTIQLYLELRRKFDSPLISARKLLFRQLLDNTPHDKINETVLNFFEDMGMLLRRNYVDREMVWDTFSYYALRWWSALKDYIGKERTDKKDNTLFKDFEDLVETIYQDEIKETGKTRTEIEPSALELRRFLEEEARL